MDIPRTYPVRFKPVPPAVALEVMIAVLNEALKADPSAIAALVNHRVPCNRTLADHPTIQVCPADIPAGFTVGMVGVINGLIEPVTGERLAYVVDDTGKVVGFQKWEREPAT